MTVSSVEDKRPDTASRPCPECGASIEYWQTSGMSDCFPHFYCDTCSNVLWRAADRQLLLDAPAEAQEAIRRIRDGLPRCACGGRFCFHAGPKCPHCRYEFKRQGDELLQANDPHAILVAGATMTTVP